MDKYLLKAKNTYRVPTVEDVEELHEQLLQNPLFTVSEFGYKTKQIKVKGEVVEEYQLVNAVVTFADEKDPEEKYDVWYGYPGQYDEKKSAEDF